MDYIERTLVDSLRSVPMTLGIRKLVVLSLAGGVFLLANVMVAAYWLQDKGVIDWAVGIRQEFLTGTAITVILALLGWTVRLP